MSQGWRPQPEGWDAVAAELAQLRARVAALEGAATARNTTISGGQGLTVQDGGQFRIIDPDGTVIAEFGALPSMAPLPSGAPQVGWILRRDSGEPVAACYTNVTGGQQSWAWTDRSGNALLADDAFSGVGLARPYLPFHVGRAKNGDWAGTNLGTGIWESIHRAEFWRQHPKLNISLGGYCDTAGATGELRVMVDGVQVGATTAVNNTAVSLWAMTVSLPGTADHLASTHILTVDVRRTAGSGAVRGEVFGVWGVQS